MLVVRLSTALKLVQPKVCNKSRLFVWWLVRICGDKSGKKIFQKEDFNLLYRAFWVKH